MPDWATHLIVPYLALTIVSKDRRLPFLLLPLAVAPDMDALFSLHRLLFHNIFTPLAPLALYIMRRNSVWAVAGAYLAAHLVLDFFSSGVALLYPLSTDLYFVETNIQYNHGFIFNLDWGIQPYNDGWRYGTGYILSSSGVGALIFLLLSGVYRRRMA